MNKIKLIDELKLFCRTKMNRNIEKKVMTSWGRKRGEAPSERNEWHLNKKKVKWKRKRRKDRNKSKKKTKRKQLNETDLFGYVS